jgi:protein-disulfide isomerase
LERVAEQHAGDLDRARFEACVASAAPKLGIEKSLAEGRSLGVSATPAMFLNGEFFEGVLTPEQIRAAIDRAIREAKQAN